MNKPEEESLESIAQELSLPFCTDLSAFEYVQNRICLLPYSFVKQNTLLPLGEIDGTLQLARCRPFDLEQLEEVRSFISLEISEVLAPAKVIEEAIALCYHQKENVATDLIASLRHEGNGQREEEEGYDLLEQHADSAVIQMLNVILTEAIQQGASDVHFEPMEQGLGIRYRIDGVLQLRHSPPKEFQSQLITRIKVMARLDIAEHRLPQDGRIKLRLGGRQIDFRVSSIPVVFGERIVLRILDRRSVLLGLQHLGMREQLLTDFQRLIHFNEGIVLVTGPTGSGKTTTLYSALSDIHSSETNVMTIEDPVEYKLQGMAQIGVNPKIHLTFATGLRHILRQDPDIIMIGEIRDRETAEIAIQSSLTGHLVLSTLHTNDAPSALTRLLDMGMEPYLLSSSVIGVLAQRLVRMNCIHCKQAYEPSRQELADLGIVRSDLPEGVLYEGKGCAHCFGSGYKGRHGIYELMVMTQGVRQQLLQSGDAEHIQEIARKEGMTPLRREGALLVARGITSSKEVLSVSNY